MYDLINRYAGVIVPTIPQTHTTEYDWLLSNIGAANTIEYQKKYRAYWAMNVARLSQNYCSTYFNALILSATTTPELANLANTLYGTPTHLNGRKSLQFSFATKLLHMRNPHSPIYDSLVAGFYFFQEPASNLLLSRRISSLVIFHSFLVFEYARILKLGLLSPAIQIFRKQLNPKHFTDEKVVDSLIWAFVDFLKRGGLVSGQAFYR